MSLLWLDIVESLLRMVLASSVVYFLCKLMRTRKQAPFIKVDKNSKYKEYFRNVAGCDEAKEEIMDFVHFLKNPKKYQKLGARIPKGVLLAGPPGTGKTLLARATAGESGLPFFSISGSDFGSLYVGTGTARVRDLFSEARKCTPSIIFIDEIDVIGRKRSGLNHKGGGVEFEGSLNKLLVEMDGFGTTSGVVVMASTNRLDVLDKALLRPGRFDRVITINTPDIKGREEIFQMYLTTIKLDLKPSDYSKRLAALTPGFVGAEIAYVCNEGALIAAREDATTVAMEHLEVAIDRVIFGLEKKNRVVGKDERRIVAYHEAGHAVVGWFLEHLGPLVKVSIVPHGKQALGFTQFLPNERLLMTKRQLFDRTCMTLGGRAAEEVLLDEVSTAAQADLGKVTNWTYPQVAVYGFSETVGLVSFTPEDDEYEMTKPYSNATSRIIDKEVRKWVDEAYHSTLELIREHEHQVVQVAKLLLENEVLYPENLVSVLGERPYQQACHRNSGGSIDNLSEDVKMV